MKYIIFLTISHTKWYEKNKLSHKTFPYRRKPMKKRRKWKIIHKFWFYIGVGYITNVSFLFILQQPHRIMKEYANSITSSVFWQMRYKVVTVGHVHDLKTYYLNLWDEKCCCWKPHIVTDSNTLIHTVSHLPIHQIMVNVKLGMSGRSLILFLCLILV